MMFLKENMITRKAFLYRKFLFASISIVLFTSCISHQNEISMVPEETKKNTLLSFPDGPIISNLHLSANGNILWVQESDRAGRESDFGRVVRYDLTKPESRLVLHEYFGPGDSKWAWDSGFSLDANEKFLLVWWQNDIKMLDAHTGQVIENWKSTEPLEWILDAKIQKNRVLAATTRHRVIIFEKSDVISKVFTTWDPSGNSADNFNPDQVLNSFYTNRIDIPNANTILVGSTDYRLFRVYSSIDGKQLAEIEIPAPGSLSMDYSSDGQELYATTVYTPPYTSATHYNGIFVWDILKGKALPKISFEGLANSKRGAGLLEIAPSGHLIVRSYHDDTRLHFVHPDPPIWRMGSEILNKDFHKLLISDDGSTAVLFFAQWVSYHDRTPTMKNAYIKIISWEEQSKFLVKPKTFSYIRASP